MGLRKFLMNLFSSSDSRSRSEPTPPRSSEDYAKEIEMEKERRRGMRGD